MRLSVSLRDLSYQGNSLEHIDSADVIESEFFQVHLADMEDAATGR